MIQITLQTKVRIEKINSLLECTLKDPQSKKLFFNMRNMDKKVY